MTNKSIAGGRQVFVTGLGTDEDPYVNMFSSDDTFQLRAAIGEIPGVEQTDKFGRLSNIDTATPPTDLWNGGGTYTGFPLGAAETLEIFSGSANDSAAGTGARTVVIGNLRDGDGNEMPDVTITLNGLTPVSLGAQTYSRSSRTRVKTAGSNGANEGEITLRHASTITNIFAVMPIGINSTTIMAFTVPAGKTLVIHRGYISLARASGAAGSANVTIRTREFIADAPFVSVRDVEVTNGSPYFFSNGGFFVFPERTDLKVTIESVSDNDTIIASEYDGYLVDNSV